MYKYPLDYKDFDDNPRRDILNFNITSTELARNITIVDSLENVTAMLEGKERELSNPDKEKLVRLLEDIVGLSYGIRSDDGRFFRKNDEILEDFRSSAMYDPFFMGLFKDQKKFETFMQGVVPKELQERAREQVQTENVVIQGEVDVPKPDAKPVPTIEELKEMLANAERDKD